MSCLAIPGISPGRKWRPVWFSHLAASTRTAHLGFCELSHNGRSAVCLTKRFHSYSRTGNTPK